MKAGWRLANTDLAVCAVTLTAAALAQCCYPSRSDVVPPVVVASISGSASEPSVLRVGDTFARAREVLGPPHYSQYVGCNIMNADFWYLPDGSVIGADAEEFGDRIRCLFLVPSDGTKGRTLESWTWPVVQPEAAPWVSAVRIVAPAIHQQAERAGQLMWSLSNERTAGD